jgi:hypothetical protein
MGRRDDLFSPWCERAALLTQELAFGRGYEYAAALAGHAATWAVRGPRGGRPEAGARRWAGRRPQNPSPPLTRPPPPR